MTRPAPLRLLGCVVAAAAAAAVTLVTAPTAGAVGVPVRSAGTSAHGAVPTGVGTAAEPDAAPLQVSLETLSPATIPVRGRLTLTGRITNRSQETWTGLNVYLVTSDQPLRTRSALARAARSEPDAQVGVRRTGDGLYATIGDLAPGRSVPYRLSVRRQDLGVSGSPGVYWVGIHVLGASRAGRDTVADGRARTFMPLLPTSANAVATETRTRLSVIVPFRQPVQRGAAGRLLDVGRWNAALAPDGRLDRLLSLGRASRVPVTWLVDPAVLDAVRSIARGNPRIDASPTGEQPTGSGSPAPSPASTPSETSDGTATDGSSPSATPSGSPAGTPDGTSSPTGDAPAGSDRSGGAPSAEAATAQSWLEEFRREAPLRSVAMLPYGDLDVAAALGGPLRGLYDQAARLSAATMPGFGVPDALPVVDPIDGYLPPAALRRIGPETPVVLREAAFPDAGGPVLRRDGRSPVVLTDDEAGSGGPAPTATYDALAVRQRVLSDAALHALSASRDRPLVVSLPASWNPGPSWGSSAFFDGLDQPWLQLVGLPSALSTAPPTPGAVPAPVYPPARRAAQIPGPNLRSSVELAATGGVFARLLTANDTVGAELAKVAMLGSSLGARHIPVLARARTTSTTGYVRAQMAQVQIEGPQFVMMSGESGPIQVTLVNGLDEPVTVGLRVTTPGSSLRIDQVKPVRLGPGRRTSIRLEASAQDIGVHAVTVLTTDSEGVPLGSEARLSVRTSHVSTVIWVIMGAAGALLLVAIVVRLYRRIRRRRATHGPLLPQPTDQEHPA